MGHIFLVLFCKVFAYFPSFSCNILQVFFALTTYSWGFTNTSWSTKYLKRQLLRRSAIEPHIGHMKSDGKLRRNYLKELSGATLNPILCAIGHNLRMIIKHYRDACYQFSIYIFRRFFTISDTFLISMRLRSIISQSKLYSSCSTIYNSYYRVCQIFCVSCKKERNVICFPELSYKTQNEESI